MAQYKYNRECGPNAVDRYDDYRDVKYYGRGTVCQRTHCVEGVGAITSCNIRGCYNDEDSYRIMDGITELCDECFSNSSIISVTLPSSLSVIGNHCFEKSKISSISLPEGLKSIGHNNFPPTLKTLEIPQDLKTFFIDNVSDCRDLKEITVDENNKFYKAKDGILYNFDMTEILFCPNAKTGKVIIPNTVTRIGNYCFAKCQSLDMVIIPTSVVEIGDYAFQGIKLKKLNIRNSVKSIGVGCFAEAVVSEEFKFSSLVLTIPRGAFESFECQPALNFIERLEIIETDAFNSCSDSALPQTISLYKTREIHNCAFQSTHNVTNIELFSSLDNLGDNIFDDCNDSLVVRCFTYAPLTSREDTLGNLGENATLVVPKGTKIIYENIAPWSTFPNIEEWETDEDKNDKGKFVKVSDEIYCKRLHSIAESKSKVDRYFIKEVIEELAQAYLYVDSDEEYEEAMALVAYNRSFSPAIIPEMEKKLCAEWTNKYKLRIIDNTLLESYAAPLVFTEQGVVQSLPKPEVVTLPLPDAIEIEPAKEGFKSSSVVAYFNEDILKQLQNNLTYARKSLKIAVSWFTNYNLFKQLKQMASDGIKIQLIINNDLINNGGYCLNFNELIENENVELSLVEYPHLLHHKFVIIDDNLLITGSYNWTRFSSKNYENMVVIKDEEIVEQFKDEFNELIEKAEYKCIDKMPDYVKERPEYDRSAFKQYITEELDAQARESTDERDKITALKKAVDLNPKYLEMINPGVQEKYNEAFKVVDNIACIQNVILNNVVQQVKVQHSKTTGGTITPTKQVVSQSKVKVGKVLTRQQEAVIETIKASGLIMCLDISGSMSDTYAKGHVHEITKKALSASLALTEEKVVNIWTFGDNAQFEGSYGINQIDQINSISSKNEGTYLQKFVEKANSSINDGALCIIFTDDDSSSISAAVEGMKQRKNVFWQIIAYEQDVKNIKAAIKNRKNISVVSLFDYQNKTDEDISEILLKNYIMWKSKS